MGEPTPRATRVILSEPGCFVPMHQRKDRFELPEGWRDGVKEVYIYFAKNFEAIIISKPERTTASIRKLALRTTVTSWKQIHIPYSWMRKLWLPKSKSHTNGFYVYSLQGDDSLALTWQLEKRADYF